MPLILALWKAQAGRSPEFKGNSKKTKDIYWNSAIKINKKSNDDDDKKKKKLMGNNNTANTSVNDAY